MVVFCLRLTGGEGDGGGGGGDGGDWSRLGGGVHSDADFHSMASLYSLKSPKNSNIHIIYSN